MTPDCSPARVALLGCAHPHSILHLGTLRVSPLVSDIVLWDPDAAAAEALGDDAGPRLRRVTSDLDRALEGVTAALVCRTNDLNPDTILEVGRRGVPVLSEKPGARTADELRPVVAGMAGLGVPLGFYYPWRLHPAIVQMRDLRRAGIFGRPMGVELRMVTSQVRFRDPNHWLFSRDRGGGGILHWLGCHFFDAIRSLLEDELSAVTAFTGTLNGFPLAVEDTAAVAMRWASGALGTFSAGYHLPLSRAGYSGAAYDTCFILRGTEGWFSWNPTRGEEVVRVESSHASWSTAPARQFRFSLQPGEAYSGAFGQALLEEFLRAVASGRAPAVTGEDALRVLEFVEGVYTSAAEGRSVVLRPPAS